MACEGFSRPKLLTLSCFLPYLYTIFPGSSGLPSNCLPAGSINDFRIWFLSPLSETRLWLCQASSMSCNTLCPFCLPCLVESIKRYPTDTVSSLKAGLLLYYFLLTCSLKQNQWSPLHVAASIAIYTTVLSVIHPCFQRILCIINPCASLVLLSCSDVTDKNHTGEVTFTLLEPLRTEYYQSYTDDDLYLQSCTF